MPDRKSREDTDQQIAVADSFPASDPPSDTGERGTRAVPTAPLVGQPRATPTDSVALSRRFADQESAKLALEALVRDGPLDPDVAELRPQGNEVELRVMAPPNNAERLRGLLMRR